MTIERSRRGRNNKKRGKRVELEVAKIVGGYRVPDTGGEFADVQTETAVYEVKSRQQATPALFAKAWHQATVAAAATDKTPYVVLAFVAGPGRPREFWLVQRLARLEGAEEAEDSDLVPDIVTESNDALAAS